MKKYILLFAFLLFSKVIYTQWTAQSSGVSARLYSVYFVDENHGWACGTNGVVLRTTNSGSNWTLVPSGTSEILLDIFFFDINEGIFVGQNGTIKKSSDGGLTWHSITSGTTGNFTNMSFIDNNRGWTCITVGEVFQTTDSGNSWLLISNVPTTNNLNKIRFIDANTGWICTQINGEIWKTTDGGSSWSYKYETASNKSLHELKFINNDIGWAVGQDGIIIKSTNGGENWSQQTSGTIYSQFGCFFYDNNHGWTVGDEEHILRTTDGGNNWIIDRTGNVFELYDVYFLDNNFGWAVGYDGTILHTDNWGGFPFTLATWTNEIFVEDSSGTEASRVLTFGQHPDATDSIDASLGEYELPPPPFPGIFDARFNLPTNPVISSFIDLRDSTQTDIAWTMQFQPGSAGYPMTFSWDSTSFPEGTFYLKDRLDGSFVFVNMKNQSSFVLTEPAITSLNISYRGNCSMVSVNNEWNMISVPLLAEDMELSNLFPTATSSAFGYNGGYIEEDTLTTGKAYWLKFGGDEQIQICGALPGDTVQVEEGWNMFGAYEEDILVSQLTTTPSGIIATNFFGFEEGYVIADTLKSGKGYWVRVTSDGEINLNSGSLEKDGNQEQIAKLNQYWGKIKITDSEGKGTTLYAAEKEIESDFYELPPIPPNRIFDARYGSGRLVEALSNEKKILISSDKYPITIRAEGISITVKDRINGKILNEELKSGEELRITNNKITSIEVSGTITGGLPISYELYQNYPNPFNPSTTIKFALPKDSKINIAIYNILGEEIEQVINQEIKAGYHQVEFRAEEYVSGVYFYRIKANDFTDTKKMVIVK